MNGTSRTPAPRLDTPARRGGASIRCATAAMLVCAALAACGGEGAEGPAPGGSGTTSPPAGDRSGASTSPGGAREPGAPTSQVDELVPPEPAPAGFEPWFDDVTAVSGPAFRHVSGHDGAFLMPEIMGGGAALFDADDDGDVDAYLVQSGALRPAPGQPVPGNGLFLNDGDGRFVDGSAGSGADDRGYGMGVACGDADGDGDLDLYVTNAGPNVLLLNDGGGRFSDGTAAAGVGDPGFAASATFADLDADGRLDLFVTNYLAWTAAGEMSCHNEMGGLDYCDPASYGAPARDVVYRNDGGGRFTDVTDASGVGGLPGTGLGVVAGDFDGDRLIDVFVANDGMPDRLWVNQGGLRFEDQALLAGCAVDTSGRAKAGMGVAAADLSGNGRLDLLVCNLDKQTDSYFVNEGGLFVDRTLQAGLSRRSRPFTRFGVVVADFDHDGELDLFQADGRVRRQWRRWADDPYAEPNLLQAGVGGGRFADLPSADGTARPQAATSRGAAAGDVDGDGDLDVLVVNRDAPAQLLVNRAGDRGGRWIGFRVLDTGGGDALGAVVTLKVGEREVRRDVQAGSSYLSSHAPRVHVGLGAAAGVTDVEVLFTDGRSEAFGAFDAGAVHLLRRGD